MQFDIRMLLLITCVVAVFLTVGTQEPHFAFTVSLILLASSFGSTLAEERERRLHVFLAATVIGVAGTIAGSMVPVCIRYGQGTQSAFGPLWLESGTEYWWISPIFGFSASVVGAMVLARRKLRVWGMRIALTACLVLALGILVQCCRSRTEIWFNAKYGNAIPNNSIGSFLRRSIGLSDITMLGLGAEFSQEDFSILERLDSLYWIRIADRDISESEFASLAQIPNLSVLHLHNCTFSSFGIRKLSSSKSLQSFSVRGARLDKTSVTAIATLPIQALHLEATQLEDCSLNSLNSIPNLQTLILLDTDLPHDFDLQLFQTLGRVSLIRANVDDQVVRSLVRQELARQNRRVAAHIAYLDLTGNQVTNNSVDQLKKLSSVLTLIVGETQVSHDALVGIRVAMPWAKVYGDVSNR